MPSIRCVVLIDEQTFVNNKKGIDSECVTHPVRLSLLRLLCFLRQNEKKPLDNFLWGYKLFNSEGPELQAMEKQTFSRFDLQSFQLFEEKLIAKASQLNAAIRANQNNLKTEPDAKRIKNVLKQALSQVCTDFNWDVPDVSSPVSLMRRRCSPGSKFLVKKQTNISKSSCNYVFVISPLENYSLKNSRKIESNIFQILTPKTLYNMLTRDSNIELFWLDHNVSENCLKFKLSESFKLQEASKFGLIPLDFLSTDIIEYGTVTLHIQKDSLVPLSAVISQCLLKEKSKEKRKIFQLSLKSIDETSLCSLNVSTIWKDETSQLTNFFEEVKEWKNLKIQSTFKLQAELFPFLIGSTLSITPAKLEDQGPFSAIMMESMAQNLIIVLECISEQETKIGLLRPITLLAACLIIPNNQIMPSVLKETNTKPENYALVKSSLENTTTQAFDTSGLEKWAIYRASNERFEMNSLETKSNDIVEKIKDLIIATENKKPQALTGRKTLVKDIKSGSDSSKANDRSLRRRRSTSSSLNLSLRSSLLLERSLSMKNSLAKESQKNLQENAKKVTNKIVPNFNLKININEDSKEEIVIAHLKDLYSQAADGTGCLLNCAQTIISILSHFSKNSEDVDVKDLADKYFFLDPKILSNKYQTPSKKTSKSREILLQALLRLELEVVLQSEKPTCDCAKNVISLLRIFSFVEGALELNKFLCEVIKENFGETLRELVEEIGEELNIPLFDNDHSSANSDSDDKAASLSILSCSSLGSASNPSVASQKNDQRRSSMVRHPSLMQSQTQRQIEVPKKLVKRTKKKETPNCKNHSKRKVRTSGRLKSTSSQNKNVPKNETKSEVRKVCRNLFEKSPRTPKRSGNVTPATPKSSEKKKTPSKRKQATKSKALTPKSKGRTPKRKYLLDSFLPRDVKASVPEMTKANKESHQSFLFQDLMSSPVAGKTSNFNSPNTPVAKCVSSIRNEPEREKSPLSGVSNSQKLYGLESPLLNIYMKKLTPVVSKCIRNLSDNLSLCESFKISSEQSDSPAKNTRSKSQDELNSAIVETPVKSNTLTESMTKNARSRRSSFCDTPTRIKEDQYNSDSSTEIEDNETIEKEMNITMKGILFKTPSKTPSKSLSFLQSSDNQTLLSPSGKTFTLQKPSTPKGSKPSTPKGLKPSTPKGLKPSTPKDLKPSTPKDLKPSTPKGLKPSTPKGLKPSTPKGLKPSTPNGSIPSTPRGSKPSTHNGPKHFPIQKRKLTLTPSKSSITPEKECGNFGPLMLYSQLHISPEEIRNRRVLRSHNDTESNLWQSPSKTIKQTLSDEIKSSPIRGNVTISDRSCSPTFIKCPNINGVILPKDDLTTQWPVKKRGRLSRSHKTEKTEWTVVHSPNDNQNLTLSFKKVPSFKDSELNDQTLCGTKPNLISPPSKRGKFNDRTYKSPSALSLIHLTTSPVLDLPIK